MSFLSEQELVDLKNTNPHASVYGYDAGRFAAAQITPAVAKTILDSALRATLNLGQQKINRPWELIRLTDKLDPKQPWIGFEFETGFNTLDEYQRVINFVWQNINHVAIDLEGYGQYCPEITFSPQNLSSYLDKSADIYTVLRWMNETKTRMPDIGDAVGTHLNLSTPSYRVADDARKRTVCDLLNHSILMLSAGQMQELFGRVPYGLGNEMGTWIEFKMFRSTDNLTKFDGYIKVAARMAAVMEALTVMPALPTYQNGTTDYIHNFYELLSGKEKDASKIVIQRTLKCDIRAHGTRSWRKRYNRTDYTQYRVAA